MEKLISSHSNADSNKRVLFRQVGKLGVLSEVTQCGRKCQQRRENGWCNVFTVRTVCSQKRRLLRG